MKFWDASAIVSLLAIEGPSWRIWDLFRQDPEIVLDGASFVTLDHRLRIAATLEGFWVFPAVDEVHDSVFEHGQHTLASELSDRPILD